MEMRGGLGWSGSMSARGWAVSAAECAPVVPAEGIAAWTRGRGGRAQGKGAAVQVRAMLGSGKDKQGALK